MENGAKGVEVIISGKLRAQRAKVGHQCVATGRFVKYRNFITLHAAVVAFVLLLLLEPGHEVQAGLLDLHWRAKEALHL